MLLDLNYTELGDFEKIPVMESDDNFTVSNENSSFLSINNNTGSQVVRIYSEDSDDYIFDKIYVRAIFLTLYTIVFCSCFFGNLMVILVVTLHWRMRSITNFCLANLAIADLCVGIFCVYQHIITYLMESWVFGEFMCKMYHFINGLSHTASILILVVICIERYLAIIHPIRCKQMMTLTRLRVTIFLVWFVSAAYSAPRLYYFGLVNHGKSEIICIRDRKKYNSTIVDMIDMIVLFLLPLIVISILYTKIGIVLWETSRTKVPTTSASESSSSSHEHYDNNRCHHSSGMDKKAQKKKFLFLSCCSRGKSRGHLNFRSKKSLLQRAGSTNYYECGGQKTTSFTSNATCQRSFRTPNITNGSDGKKHILTATCCGHNDCTCICANSALPYTPGTVQPTPNGQSGSSCLHRPDTPANTGSDTLPINSTDPIVVVKFEKRSSFRKSKRSRCMITMSSAAESKESTGELSKQPQSTNGNGRCVHCHTCNGSLDQTQNEMNTDGASLDSSNMSFPLDANPSNQNCNTHLNVQTTTSDHGHSPRSNTHQGGKLKRLRVIRGSKYGQRALQSRRKIIRMLIVIVVTFALCNLPFHGRKMWQYYGSGYDGGDVFSALFTPITFLIMYGNSGVNPILYAFMSKKFRLSFRDLLCCKLRRNMRPSRHGSLHSTHVIPMQMTNAVG